MISCSYTSVSIYIREHKMTLSTSQPFYNPSVFYSPARLAVGAVFEGATTALAAGLFTTISPLGGAIFGVSQWLSFHLIQWISDKINCCADSLIGKIAQLALSWISSTVIGVLVTTAIGIPITLATGAVLTIASLVVGIAVGLAFTGCFCSSAIATGLVLGN